MSSDVRFALIRRLDPVTKPIVFSDIDQLARSIQRRRGRCSIEMIDHEDLQLEGRAGSTPAVAVWTLDAGNDREALIGFAYLDGRGQDALRAALSRNAAIPTSRAA